MNNLNRETDMLLHSGTGVSASDFAAVANGTTGIETFGSALRGASSAMFDARGRIYSTSPTTRTGW